MLLVGDGGRVVARFPVESGGFSGSWVPSTSELITWTVEGGQDGAVLPQTLEIEVLPDSPPELALPVPGSDGELPLSLRIPLFVESNDDFGVSWVEVETSHQRPGEEDVTAIDRIPTGGLPQVTLRPMLGRLELGGPPGGRDPDPGTCLGQLTDRPDRGDDFLPARDADRLRSARGREGEDRRGHLSHAGALGSGGSRNRGAQKPRAAESHGC